MPDDVVIHGRGATLGGATPKELVFVTGQLLGSCSLTNFSLGGGLIRPLGFCELRFGSHLLDFRHLTHTSWALLVGPTVR